MKADLATAVLADVDAFCRELRPIEELCYVEHRHNDQLVELARKHDILGLPIPTEYGGRGWSELYRVGRHLQDVRVCRIYEGTDEIMQLKIASALLGKDYAAFG